MKAIHMTGVGGTEVLQPREVNVPALTGDDQVLVRLRAAGLNPVDIKIRSRGLLTGSLPAVPGCDGSGVVVAVGPAVTQLAVGDAVWFCHGGLGGAAGNYAEYALVPGHVARLKPRAYGFVHAAAAPLVLITAWEALFDRASAGPGKVVLIHGGAGGVGHVAIQLAKHAGARVITTVGGRDRGEFVCGLGADEVIYYKDQDFVAEVNRLTDGRGVDIALDTQGGEVFQRTVDAVAHYGDLVTVLDPGVAQWQEARSRNLRIGLVLMLTPMLRDLPAARAHHGEILDACAALADEGQLHIHVSHTFPLTETAAAHACLEAGHMQGKVVLSMSS